MQIVIGAQAMDRIKGQRESILMEGLPRLYTPSTISLIFDTACRNFFLQKQSPGDNNNKTRERRINATQAKDTKMCSNKKWDKIMRDIGKKDLYKS